MTHLGPSLRRRRRRDRPWLRVAVAVTLSLVANAVVLRTIDVGFVPGTRSQATRPVALAPLSRSEWEANRRVTSAAPARPALPQVQQPTAPRPQPPPPPPRMQGQVVDVAPSANQTPPKESRFLAEHDSTVEKETRSRHAGPGFEKTLPKPSEPHPPQPTGQQHERAVAAGEGGRAGVKTPGAPPVPKPSTAATASRPASRPAEPKLALHLRSMGDLRLREPRPDEPKRDAQHGADGQSMAREEAPAPDRPAGEAGPAGLPGKTGPLANLQLRPTAATYDRLVGGPAPDKLDGVQEGDGTFLNTRGWKYAGYFNRISQAVRGQWDPNGAMRARDPSGTRFGAQDWTTLLVVKLDEGGSLKDVLVQKSSGLDFLDNAAVQALRRAQPFTNPPHGLADDRGEIVFSYGFTLQGSFGLDRVFRRGAQE